jgi:hypothetical protein
MFNATQLWASAQKAAAKANLLTRFSKSAGTFRRFGEWLAAAPRKAVAGTGFGALGLSGGLLFLPFPQSWSIPIFLAIASGSIAVLLTPASIEDRRAEAVKKLLKLYDEMERRGLKTELPRFEEQIRILGTADNAYVAQYLIAGSRSQEPSDQSAASEEKVEELVEKVSAAALIRVEKHMTLGRGDDSHQVEQPEENV